MRPGERARVLFEMVERRGDVSIADLAKRLDVSEMTVRRDLERLERGGALRRVQGRVMRGVSGSYEPPYAIRAERRAAEKAIIAQVIASKIADRETVVLDGGSTGVAVARALADRDITVCTPSLRVADVLRGTPNIQLMVTGGVVRRGEETLVGPSAAATLEAHRFDTYVMTVSGLDVVAGCTEWNVDDAIVKRVALRVSTRCIVAADSAKFGTTTFARICDLDAVTSIVTDSGLSVDFRKAMALAGVSVDVAE